MPLLVPSPSRGLSLVDRFPYLFFKYRAHELKASLSPSDPPRSGDGSRDFNVCVERLRDNSDPEDADEVPYLNLDKACNLIYKCLIT